MGLSVAHFVAYDIHDKSNPYRDQVFFTEIITSILKSITVEIKTQQSNHVLQQLGDKCQRGDVKLF